MPKNRTPRPLDRYPSDYEKLFRIVGEKGRHAMKFHSESEAHTIKFDLRRYIESVIHYAPESDLADICRMAMIKKRELTLEVILRTVYSAMTDLRASFEQESETADPLAEQMRIHEAAMAELKRTKA